MASEPLAGEDLEAPASRRFKLVERYWRWLVGVALIVALVASVGPGPLIEACRRVAPGPASIVVALAAVWLVLGAFNVWILLRSLHPLLFRDFLPTYLHSWSLSLVLPGQLGDATQILLLRRHGVAVSTSSAAYLLDKVFSFSWILLVAMYGVGLFLPDLGKKWLLAAPLVGAVGGILLSVTILHWPARSGTKLYRLRLHFKRALYQARGLLRRPGLLAVNATVTITKWLVVSCMYLGAFTAFGSRIGFEAAATIPTMSSLVAYLPISVGGLGTMEWTAVALFHRIDLAGATVLSVYLFFRVTLLGLALVAMASLAHDGDGEANTTES